MFYYPVPGRVVYPETKKKLMEKKKKNPIKKKEKLSEDYYLLY